MRKPRMQGGMLTAFAASQLLLMLLMSLDAAIAEPTRPERGYAARACGFDMNRNGVWSEPADCRVCDGTTADPDGDGLAEDLIYIDCNAGINDGDCGAPGDPCRTIAFAWTSRADGPADGAEDILCFRGTCASEELVQPSFGGVAGTYQVAASGSESRAWSYPRHPAMLVGWDTDGDGAYPPFDTDDVAVIDGSAGRARLFRLGPQTDHLEMAHFTVRNYGRFTAAENSGFVSWGPSGGTVQFQYFHDIELYGTNQDRATTSFTSLVNLFPSAAIPQWIHFQNLRAFDTGQWFARGSGYDQGPDMGPFRFSRISYTGHSCDFSACGTSASVVGFKLWGYLSGVEILDSSWNANVGNWEPKAESGPSGAVFAFAVQCTRDWLIRNNEVIDFKNPFIVQGHSTGFCDGAAARSVDEIRIDGNYVRNTFAPWNFGDHGVRIEDGGALPGEVIEDVHITNNFMESTTGWEAGVWSLPGHATIPPTGTIAIVNNTFFSNVNRHGAIVIGNPEGADENFPHQNYLLINNIFGGFVATNNGEKDVNIRTTYPVTLASNFNVFDPNGEFVWNDGGRLSLAAWRTATGDDFGSRLCTPLFVNGPAGDWHLHPLDTCAKNQGQIATPFVLYDIDGENHYQIGPADIGADEIPADLFTDGFETGNTSQWANQVP